MNSSDPLGGINKPVVSYFYDDEIGCFQYNQGHPMKPFRVKMTDEMIGAYGMHDHMKRMHVEQEFIDNVDFTVFHSDDYVDVLKNLTPENKDLYADQINRCKEHS
jgi:histone deacetylase 1/2